MPCGVTTCSITDDRFLWKCEFCNKKYHAACIGVQRQREFLITAFMVAMCADCQDILRKEADVRKLLHQQEQLVNAIHSQTDANHRIAADLKKFSVVSDLFESIEHLLNDVKETLAIINKNNQTLCTAVSQHMNTCDTQMHTTITGINESNSMMSQKITKFLDERLVSLTNDMTLSTKKAETSSPHLNYDESKLLEILEEVKFVSGAVSSLQITAAENTKPHQKTLEEELAENPPVPTTTDEELKGNSPVNDCTHKIKNGHPSAGWRFLGNKRCYKQDWSEYDAKQRIRRLQENAAEKAKSRKKRRKHQYSRSSSHHPTYNTLNAKVSDKQLLAAAKLQFACPPVTTDHPIAALSVPKLISFRKGETINPYRPEKQSQHAQNTVPLPSNNQQQPQQQQHQQQQQSANRQPAFSSVSRFELDPLRPPIVRITEQSTEGDGRILKARLREPKIMKAVRLFLAYMKDQDPQNSVCVDGMTPTSIRMYLASEGLPLDSEHLLRIFIDVHQEYGMDPAEAMADLSTYRKYLSSERIHRLQQLRDSDSKFRNPSFRK